MNRLPLLLVLAACSSDEEFQPPKDLESDASVVANDAGSSPMDPDSAPEPLPDAGVDAVAPPVVLQDKWGVTPVGASPLAARFSHAGTWTGTAMFVWGGQTLPNARTSSLRDGALYDPATQTWKPIADAPEPRGGARAVWTGSKVVVWGGIGTNGPVNTGMVYDPLSNSWSAFTQTNPPAVRSNQMMVFFNNKIFVWGGFTSAQVPQRADGAIYDLATNAWTPVGATGAPSARQWTDAVWTGTKILTWGACLPYGNSGAEYDPATDSWQTMNITGAPTARCGHSVTWTGSRMVIFGGSAGGLGFANGGVYDPASATWAPMGAAPAGRVQHTAIWTGRKMIVWGGFSNYDNQRGMNDGVVYE